MTVRPPAIAGAFYPASAAQLKADVEGFLAEANPSEGPVPKAIIAPHAGLIYSGPVAATAYARLKPAAQKINRVILLGPNHRVPLQGIALSTADYFETPLGRVPIDKRAMANLRGLPFVGGYDQAHAQEHSLEIHLPFLQVQLEDFTLVPLIVGQVGPHQVAEVLRRLWGGPETLIVVSSDLSHYLNYKEAKEFDSRTSAAIENLAPEAIEQKGACGRFPVGGLLQLAKESGMSVETVDLRNSGDTAGNKDRVVGYGSWLFFEEEFETRTKALIKEHGDRLLHIAGNAITLRLKNPANQKIQISNVPGVLRSNGASFVTLKTPEGQLRGCMGTSEAYQPLALDVATNATKAAFRDPRFKPITEAERPNLQLSVSVLSPKEEMTIKSRADLLSQLRPGIDGLIIRDGNLGSLFLPTVWEELKDPDLFLSRLSQKAGMPPDHWSHTFKAWRFISVETYNRDLENPGSVWG